MSLLKDFDRLSRQQLSAMYGVSKTTAGNVLRRKSEYIDAYRCNASPDREETCIREGSHVELERVVLTSVQFTRSHISNGYVTPRSWPVFCRSHRWSL